MTSASIYACYLVEIGNDYLTLQDEMFIELSLSISAAVSTYSKWSEKHPAIKPVPFPGPLFIAKAAVPTKFSMPAASKMPIDEANAC